MHIPGRKFLFVRGAVFASALVLVVFSGLPVSAQEPGTDQPVGAQQGVSPTGQASQSPARPLVEFFPEQRLYAPYLADPGEVGFGFQVLHYTRTTIPDSGNLRFDLKAGGQFGLLRLNPDRSDFPALQLSLEGGLNAQFDIDHRLDNIGWDGRYALLLTSAPARDLAFKLGYQHDSSHVGDEYMQRTGRLRIGYTREEIAAGASWLPGNGFRTYGEYGQAVTMGSELQKRGRAQFGLEWQQPKPGLGLYRGWYAAADFTAMEERDWRVDTSVQAGYRLDTVGKTWRFGLDWYKGRPPIGEFFQETESYLGFGLWVDI